MFTRNLRVQSNICQVTGRRLHIMPILESGKILDKLYQQAKVIQLWIGM